MHLSQTWTKCCTSNPIMWYLVCRSKDGRSYRLTQDKKEHFVGRIAGDIILNGDQSVSRKHAIFAFEVDTNGKTVATIKDLNSRYGTYVNGSFKLEPNEPHQLADGDLVTFGCQWNEWGFHSKPLVVTTSTMSNEAKARLRRLISDLGGAVVGDWQESCSHVTMTEILLTAKVVNALASATPIVTPEYWEKFKEAIDGQKVPPNCDQFIPPLKELILNRNRVSFAVNETRKQLFSGKIFVFSSEKQMKKYKSIVIAAGGSCQTLLDCGMTVNELCGPDVIVMQHLTTDTEPPALYSHVLRETRKQGLRLIPESEIGLAILMVSLDTHCNMRYNVVGNVLEGGIVMSQVKRDEIFADDSQRSINEQVAIKTEDTIKREQAEENKLTSTTPVLSAMASASLSSQGSDSLREWQKRDTVECGVDQASPQNEIPIEENPSPSPVPGPSRKRPGAVDLGEPSAKRIPSEVKAPGPGKKNYITEISIVDDGPSTSKTFGSRLNEKVDTPSSCVASKRKFDAVDNSAKDGEPRKKSGKVQAFSVLFPGFANLPSTSGSGLSTVLGVEDEDEWQKDGAKGIKAALSSDWGDKFKELESKRPMKLKDVGVGMVLKMANLIVDDRDKQKGRKSPVHDPTIVNYKKFRKVKPVSDRACLPVIRESDLVPYEGGNLEVL
ncbi:nibrin [Hetaerina americana]|uniref:nibrin n=1 Tax=Hetaerina americana TaxID=62018 RepID=UPI003A7F5659